MDHLHHQIIPNLGRLLLCLAAFALLSRLPSAATFSHDLLRRATAAVVRPSFAFLVGNALVLLLFRYSSGDDRELGSDYLQVPVKEEDEVAEVADVAVEEEEVVVVDDDEEFRRTVEEFIEKQVRFHRRESRELVCSAGTTDQQ